VLDYRSGLASSRACAPRQRFADVGDALGGVGTTGGAGRGRHTRARGDVGEQRIECVDERLAGELAVEVVVEAPARTRASALCR
jgi:hypothetical protein